jgi:membrane-bound lytic murein transglycosylase D
VNDSLHFKIPGIMKWLLTCVFFLGLSQFTKADAAFTADSSRTLRGRGANFLSKEGYRDTVQVPMVIPVKVSPYQNSIYKRRLDAIQKDVQLDYNGFVQSNIDVYLGQREEIGRLIGLSKYYFPIYEKSFRDAGIPDEIKYLSIVESQLNPYAISRVGATGPWQFMGTTAKIYGLNMDSYVDERRDPIQSSQAAAAYLKDAYQEFGDWLVAIASYNCGKSNVIRAIEEAGANDFWSIRPYLPVETRGYVPAYIAMTYMMNYYEQYNISPQQCNYMIKTDTVSVNKLVSLSSISETLNIDPTTLAVLNPQYRMLMINGSAASPRTLVIPKAVKEKYAATYNSLNAEIVAARPHSAYTSYVEVELPKPKPQPMVAVIAPIVKKEEVLPPPKKKEPLSYISYRVQQGDTLAAIANKFGGTTPEDIKEQNGLKTDDVQPGMMLMISKS